MTTVMPEEWVDQLETLSAEVKTAATGLGAQEARYLVDSYYDMQEQRKRTANQIRALTESGETAVLAEWLEKQSRKLENDVRRLLQGYAEGSQVGAWSLSQVGIGPVIAAGLLAHIDIAKATTAGAIWRFAGLDNPANYEWAKGQRRPWNARLKVLCWKIGDSFVKQSGREQCYYGHVYRDRKTVEVERNEAGAFADTARITLDQRKIGDNDTRKRYEAGKLPDGRLDLRARRYAVKLFLSHWQHVAYEAAYGVAPPKPYVIEHGGHAHYLAPPNWPMA